MGIILFHVTFDAPAPVATEISARISDLAGLPIVVNDIHAKLGGTLHDLYAQIAFETYPRTQVTVSAYRAGAVKEHLKRTGMGGWPVATIVEGANEIDGEQTVSVEGYVGQEPTILLATVLSLESLGGRLVEPIRDDERQRYGAAVSPEELRRRHRSTKRHASFSLALGIVLLPLLLPIFLISIIWHLITLPWRLKKGRQKLKAWKTRNRQSNS
jgi:hypothetical protein